MAYLANRIERNLRELHGLPIKSHCPHEHEYTLENTYWQTKRDRGIERKTACCRECQKIRMRRKRLNPVFLKQEAAKSARWRKRHPEKYEEGWKRAHAEKKQILDQARAGGCVRCGESDLACLDFHHRDNGTTKDADIATMRRFGTKRLLAEIAKCDVLCANCHRKHHRDERERVNQ